MFFGGSQNLADRLLDTKVHRLEAVIGQDDLDEVLADVVNIAAHRRQQDAALAGILGLLHVRFEVGDRSLHGLGRLQNERQLHFALAEKFADDLHSLEKVLVDDLERRFGLQRFV